MENETLRQREEVPHTQVHNTLRRSLETVQDLAIILLMVLLTGITVQALWHLGRMAFVHNSASGVVLSQIVLILLLTEIYRTLIFYLREHRVSVALIVEVGIIALVEDMILRSAQEFELDRAIATSVLLVVLGGMLALQRWLGQTGSGYAESSAH